jgi:hypothetical protein
LNHFSVYNKPREFTIGQPMTFTITDVANQKTHERLSQGSSISELLEGGKPSQKDDDEDGYANVEDVHEAKHVTRMEESRPRYVSICVAGSMKA